MKLFVCSDHAGHYPVGVASVIVAPDELSAREMLNVELRSRHLADATLQPFTLSEVNADVAGVHVICDGDY